MENISNFWMNMFIFVCTLQARGYYRVLRSNDSKQWDICCDLFKLGENPAEKYPKCIQQALAQCLLTTKTEPTWLSNIHARAS